MQVTMPFASNTMYRVYDETVQVPIRGRPAPYRVRIWMARDTKPVVLVSADPVAKQPPSWAASRIANHLHRTLLRGAIDFRYFESFTGAKLTEVRFEHFELKSGPHHFTSSSGLAVAWEALESLVGEPVERI